MSSRSDEGQQPPSVAELRRMVGAPIQDWRIGALESLTCETFVEGRSVGRGGAYRLDGGPLRSVQFMLQLAAERGRPLRAGQVVATGQTSGIHDVTPGQSGRVVFADDGEVRCRLVAARSPPVPEGRHVSPPEAGGGG